MVSRETLNAGHVRPLLGLKDPAQQVSVAERMARRGLSVREAESLVAELREGRKGGRTKKQRPKPANIRDLEDKIRTRLGSKVSIETKAKGAKGKIVVEFASHDDFERILGVIGVSLSD
jgi:ParB family chromosome partitioning protein